jgi:uncharacterized RDD family membrane protein YckC
MRANPHRTPIGRFAAPARLAAILAFLLVTEAAVAQPGRTSRRVLQSNPSQSAALGQVVTLSVYPAAATDSYRFVATMVATGDGTQTSPTVCLKRGQVIGTGTSIAWAPATGTYRLTAYPLRAARTGDTLAATYVVRAPDAVVTAVYDPPQPPPGGTTLASLIVSARDLGPGHRYRFFVRFGSPAVLSGQQPPPVPAPWTFESEEWSLRFPVPVASTVPAFATATVHRGDPCHVVATGAGQSHRKPR